MHFIEQIKKYTPVDEQEKRDKKIILELWENHGDHLFSRHLTFAHMTSSGFILNESKDKTLFIHHNIYHSWGWTGGHADGESDLLQVALREAREETGIRTVRALKPEIASIDILPVFAHQKNGAYVGVHLHFGAAYLLVADDGQPLFHHASENSAAAWIPLDKITSHCQEDHMQAVYQKLIRRAEAWL